MIRKAGFIAALTAVVAMFILNGSALAHASITSVSWDNPTSPTRLTAVASEEISNAPGDFALRVYNASGAQVDLNNASMRADNKAIIVGVRANLPAGTYSVQWKVVSEDGHESTGTLPIAVGAAAAATTAAPAHTHDAPSAAAMPTTSTTTHSHDDEDDHAAVPVKGTAPITIEVKLTGAAEVPPVSTAASGFARLVFNPVTNELSYAITASGVAPQAITGLHIHTGSKTENGPHAFDIINAPFTTVSGKTILSAATVADLYAGNLYLNLHTIDVPSGAARGQIIVPASAPATGHAATTSASTSTVRPPSTGEAGLAASHSSSTALTAIVVAAALVLTTGGVLALQRR
ncbi:MAG: CHRD domain-containing protein [Dehalococcoidia bacterium]